MQLQIVDGLPFVTVHASYQGSEIEIPDVLIDTGSAATIFAVDVLARVGIAPRLDDEVHFVRGVGGRELVFIRELDKLQVGSQSLYSFTIQISGMDYGFMIGGILGMDFLRRSGAVIDLRQLQIEFAD